MSLNNRGVVWLYPSPQYVKLKEIMDNKTNTEFFEDEKELLWKLRNDVREHYPESLSKLLLITKWNKRDDVVQVLKSGSQRTHNNDRLQAKKIRKKELEL